jgi:hypothetical protein
VTSKISRFGFVVGGALVGACAHGQVANLLNALDAGSHSLGMGSALTATDAEVLSTFNNPAGLGYLSGRQFAIAYGNLPTAASTVSDVYGDRSFSSYFNGDSDITYFGVTLPLSTSKNHGTIGFCYNVGGFLDDVGTSNGVLPYSSNTNLEAANYTDQRYAKDDYVTVSYGKTNNEHTMSLGFGLTYVQQSTIYQQQFSIYDTTSGSPVLASTQNTGYLSGAGSGVGAIAGIELIPANTPNLSFGLSLRSPIRLGGGGAVDQYYSVIPGKLLAGAALRGTGLKRRSSDFTVLGVQVEQYFGGSGQGLFAQQAQTVTDLGGEYDFGLDSFNVPVRIGYRSIPSGGSQFADVSALTYGLGIHDKENRYSLDANWSRITGGMNQLSITASVRFSNP